ncbi:MAG: alkaline phosphatase family protein [Candidatus Eisenbacteria bacterium]|nr:alkaline phosphatase family protein [Candidatus Eisenbacteria bacterium]
MKLEKTLALVTVCVIAAAVIVGVVKWRGAARPAGRVHAPEAEAEGKVALLVVGIEGLEPSVFEPLVREGRLPNLSRLLAEGAYARFPSLGRNTDPRIAWTSLVTGVTPERQGIGGKVPSPKGAMVALPLRPSSRTVDTAWTLLSKAGVTVAVLGWPGTWPVEQVNGLMVGPYATYVLERTRRGRPEDAVHPPDAYAAVDSLVRAGDSYRRISLARFVDMASAMGLEALTGHNIEVLTGSCAGDTTMLTLARAAVARHGATAVFVSLPGLDAVSQRFWVYRDPKPSPTLMADAAAYLRFRQMAEALRGTTAEYYEYVDEILGHLVALAAEEGTIAVIADHGYSGLELDSSGNPKIGREMHSESGVLLLRGPCVAAGARAEKAALFDVAPTIMRAAGMQVPAGLDGRVLEEVMRP